MQNEAEEEGGFSLDVQQVRQIFWACTTKNRKTRLKLLKYSFGREKLAVADSEPCGALEGNEVEDKLYNGEYDDGSVWFQTSRVFVKNSEFLTVCGTS